MSLLRTLRILLCYWVLCLEIKYNGVSQASRRLPPPIEQNAILRLISPQADSVVNSKDLDLFFDVENVEISRDKFRIVVILGGSQRVTLDHPLKPASFRNLSPGTYLLRAFLISPRGAMLRSPDSQLFTQLHILKKTGDENISEKPLLTVASPQGEFPYNEARLVLFDFSTKNFQLGYQGIKLRYRIGNFTGLLTQNSPVFLADLPPGEHILFAEVIGENGEPLKGPFLSAVCKFKILDPPEAPQLPSQEEITGRAAGPTEEEALLGVQIPRVRIISPEPGVMILTDDPAWE